MQKIIIKKPYLENECFFCYVEKSENNKCLMVYEEEEIVKRPKLNVCFKCLDICFNDKSIKLFEQTEFNNIFPTSYDTVREILQKKFQCTKNLKCNRCNKIVISSFKLACCNDHENIIFNDEDIAYYIF